MATSGLTGRKAAPISQSVAGLAAQLLARSIRGANPAQASGAAAQRPRRFGDGGEAMNERPDRHLGNPVRDGPVEDLPSSTQRHPVDHLTNAGLSLATTGDFHMATRRRLDPRTCLNWEERSRTLLAEFGPAAGQHAGT